jgi:hypothetical protein
MQTSDALTRLALDLGWSWNHSAGENWKKLDPELWELTAKTRRSVGSSGTGDGGQ